jgi:hypothetical protein
MNINVYTIYDEAAKAYITPFFMQNDGLAIRAFQDNVNSKDESNIAKHPEQFTLFKIGVYDDQRGVIDRIEHLKALGNGLEFKTLTEEDNKVLKELSFIKKLLEDK